MMLRHQFDGFTTIRRGLAALVIATAVCSTPSRVLAQSCTTNPGGPGEIQMILQSAGSDIDIGWMDAAHNIGVPAGSSIGVCLENCDTTTDPVCDIVGTIEGVTAGTTNVAPPMPLYVDNRETPVCALLQFPPPGITGTADVETGAISAGGTLQGRIFVGACPQCTGASPGALGTCQGGATPGGVCTTDQFTTVTARINDVLTDIDYAVSRDCLPSGTSFTLSQAVSVATSVQSVNQPCPNQQSGTNGFHECGVAGCVGVCTPGSEANGGTHQNCCNNGTTACFPGTITRNGSATAPVPAWPDPTYPKTSDFALAGAFCVGSVNAIFVDPEVGLPGPLALIWPGSAEWLLGSDTTTTTTTTLATTTTTLAACTTPSQCNDGDDCTEDVCDNSVCSNPPLPDVAFAACEANKAKNQTLCDGTTIDAKLAAAIQKALNTASTKLAGIGETTGKKRTKALKKARKALTKLQNKVTKAVTKKKNPLPQECADEINALLTQLLGLIPSS